MGSSKNKKLFLSLYFALSVVNISNIMHPSKIKIGFKKEHVNYGVLKELIFDLLLRRMQIRSDETWEIGTVLASKQKYSIAFL